MLDFGKFIKMAGLAGLLPPAPTAVAASNLSAGNLVYVKADGELGLADATAEGKEAIGFVEIAYNDGQLSKFHGAGALISGLSELTPGARYFMTTAPGAISLTPPASTGNVVMCIGRAISTTAILFAPEIPITL